MYILIILASQRFLVMKQFSTLFREKGLLKDITNHESPNHPEILRNPFLPTHQINLQLLLLPPHQNLCIIELISLVHRVLASGPKDIHAIRRDGLNNCFENNLFPYQWQKIHLASKLSVCSSNPLSAKINGKRKLHIRLDSEHSTVAFEIMQR
jgi:hypothetical protein